MSTKDKRRNRKRSDSVSDRVTDPKIVYTMPKSVVPSKFSPPSGPSNDILSIRQRSHSHCPPKHKSRVSFTKTMDSLSNINQTTSEDDYTSDGSDPINEVDLFFQSKANSSNYQATTSDLSRTPQEKAFALYMKLEEENKGFVSIFENQDIDFKEFQSSLVPLRLRDLKDEMLGELGESNTSTPTSSHHKMSGRYAQKNHTASILNQSTFNSSNEENGEKNIMEDQATRQRHFFKEHVIELGQLSLAINKLLNGIKKNKDRMVVEFKKREEIESKNKDLENKVQQKEEQLRHMMADNEALFLEVGIREQSQKEKNKLLIKIKELESFEKDKDVRIKNLNEDLSQCRSELDAVKQELKSEHENLLSQESKLKGRITTVSREKIALSEKVQDLEKKIKDLNLPRMLLKPTNSNINIREEFQPISVAISPEVQMPKPLIANPASNSNSPVPQVAGISARILELEEENGQLRVLANRFRDHKRKCNKDHKEVKRLLDRSKNPVPLESDHFEEEDSEISDDPDWDFKTIKSQLFDKFHLSPKTQAPLPNSGSPMITIGPSPLSQYEHLGVTQDQDIMDQSSAHISEDEERAINPTNISNLIYCDSEYSSDDEDFGKTPITFAQALESVSARNSPKADNDEIHFQLTNDMMNGLVDSLTAKFKQGVYYEDSDVFSEENKETSETMLHIKVASVVSKVLENLSAGQSSSTETNKNSYVDKVIDLEQNSNINTGSGISSEANMLGHNETQTTTTKVSVNSTVNDLSKTNSTLFVLGESTDLVDGVAKNKAILATTPPNDQSTHSSLSQETQSLMDYQNYHPDMLTGTLNPLVSTLLSGNAKDILISPIAAIPTIPTTKDTDSLSIIDLQHSAQSLNHIAPNQTYKHSLPVHLTRSMQTQTTQTELNGTQFNFDLPSSAPVLSLSFPTETVGSSHLTSINPTESLITERSFTDFEKSDQGLEIHTLPVESNSVNNFYANENDKLTSETTQPLSKEAIMLGIKNNELESSISAEHRAYTEASKQNLDSSAQTDALQKLAFVTTEEGHVGKAPSSSSEIIGQDSKACNLPHQLPLIENRELLSHTRTSEPSMDKKHATKDDDEFLESPTFPKYTTFSSPVAPLVLTSQSDLPQLTSAKSSKPLTRSILKTSTHLEPQTLPEEASNYNASFEEKDNREISKSIEPHPYEEHVEEDEAESLAFLQQVTIANHGKGFKGIIENKLPNSNQKQLKDLNAIDEDENINKSIQGGVKPSPINQRLARLSGADYISSPEKGLVNKRISTISQMHSQKVIEDIAHPDDLINDIAMLVQSPHLTAKIQLQRVIQLIQNQLASPTQSVLGQATHSRDELDSYETSQSQGSLAVGKLQESLVNADVAKSKAVSGESKNSLGYSSILSSQKVDSHPANLELDQLRDNTSAKEMPNQVQSIADTIGGDAQDQEPKPTPAQEVTSIRAGPSLIFSPSDASLPNKVPLPFAVASHGLNSPETNSPKNSQAKFTNVLNETGLTYVELFSPRKFEFTSNEPESKENTELATHHVPTEYLQQLVRDTKNKLATLMSFNPNLKQQQISDELTRSLTQLQDKIDQVKESQDLTHASIQPDQEVFHAPKPVNALQLNQFGLDKHSYTPQFTHVDRFEKMVQSQRSSVENLRNASMQTEDLPPVDILAKKELTTILEDEAKGEENKSKDGLSEENRVALPGSNGVIPLHTTQNMMEIVRPSSSSLVHLKLNRSGSAVSMKLDDANKRLSFVGDQDISRPSTQSPPIAVTSLKPGTSLDMQRHSSTFSASSPIILRPSVHSPDFASKNVEGLSPLQAINDARANLSRTSTRPNSPQNVFYISPEDLEKLSKMHTKSAEDTAVLAAVVSATRGEHMFKYTRNFITTEDLHRRFFWLNPYTKMLSWASRKPDSTWSKKSPRQVFIRNVEEVKDGFVSKLIRDNLDLGLLITTSTRQIQVKAESLKKHQMWLTALKYVATDKGSSEEIFTKENERNFEAHKSGSAFVQQTLSAQPLKSKSQSLYGRNSTSSMYATGSETKTLADKIFGSVKGFNPIRPSNSQSSKNKSATDQNTNATTPDRSSVADDATPESTTNPTTASSQPMP